MLRLTRVRSIGTESPLALHGSVERHAKLVTADRTERLRTFTMAVFDGLVVFDFDEVGRLGAIEIVLSINRWRRSSVTIPVASETVVLGLRDPPRDSATLSFDRAVQCRRDHSSKAIEALFSEDDRFDRCYAIGSNVFVTTQDGWLVAVYMDLRGRYS